MDQLVAAPPSLLELLARQWQRPAPVTRLSFSHDGATVAFAAADGSLALVSMSDPEAPEQRLRISGESGRATIRRRERPVRPAILVGPLDDRALPLAPHRTGSFAVGDGQGRVLAITPRGQIRPLDIRLDGRVVAIDHHAASRRTACAAGDRIALLADEDGTTLQHLDHEQPLAAVAFSPDGRQLAAAHPTGVSLWRLDGAAERRDLPFAGDPTGVSWSPGGDWIACPLAGDGFQLLRPAEGGGGAVLGYPTPVRSIAWSAAAGAVATGGAFRAVAWALDRPPLDDATAGALQTGRPGLVVVDCVAAHPHRDLLAVGYANGQVSIVQLGRRDELLLRQDGGGAVRALAWSGDGRHLAIGAADGTAAVASFPPHMFK